MRTSNIEQPTANIDGQKSGLRVSMAGVRVRRVGAGYTLIEVMVVAVVVLLMLGMALPVFRAINGSRSEAGAANYVASLLGHARADAMGLQRAYGIAFIYNPATRETLMAEVYFPTLIGGYDSLLGAKVPPSGYFLSTKTTPVTYYVNSNTSTQTFSASGSVGTTTVNGMPLDIVPDTDVVHLPAGIGVQTVCNCSFNSSGTRSSNGYLSVGVILFDSQGKMTSLPYGISRFSKLAGLTGLASDRPTANNIGVVNSAGNITTQGVFSQFGVVVYQQEAFQNYTASVSPEALYTDKSTYGNPPLANYTTGSPTQQSADNWLDQNSTPLVIDRYTGTLVKGE